MAAVQVSLKGKKTRTIQDNLVSSSTKTCAIGHYGFIIFITINIMCMSPSHHVTSCNDIDIKWKTWLRDTLNENMDKIHEGTKRRQLLTWASFQRWKLTLRQCQYFNIIFWEPSPDSQTALIPCRLPSLNITLIRIIKQKKIWINL